MYTKNRYNYTMSLDALVVVIKENNLSVWIDKTFKPSN